MSWCSRGCGGCRVLGTTPGPAGARGGSRARTAESFSFVLSPGRGFPRAEATEAFHAETWQQFMGPGQPPELGEQPVAPGTARLTANEMLLDGVFS